MQLKPLTLTASEVDFKSIEQEKMFNLVILLFKLNFVHHTTKGQDLTIISALKSGSVICDTHFKHKHYLLFTCACIMYNLFLLKTRVSLHVLLGNRKQAKIMVASADAETFGSLYDLPLSK